MKTRVFVKQTLFFSFSRIRLLSVPGQYVNADKTSKKTKADQGTPSIGDDSGPQNIRLFDICLML